MDEISGLTPVCADMVGSLCESARALMVGPPSLRNWEKYVFFV